MTIGRLIQVLIARGEVLDYQDYSFLSDRINGIEIVGNYIRIDYFKCDGDDDYFDTNLNQIMKEDFDKAKEEQMKKEKKA